MKPPDWMAMGACVGADPDLWFPDMSDTNGQNAAHQAITTCQTCPVIGECDQYATEEDITDGIWGGIIRSRYTTGGGPGRGRRRESIRHGTLGGARTHHRRGEKLCEACAYAQASYARARSGATMIRCQWPRGKGCNTWAMRGETLCWNHLRMSNESGQNADPKATK